MFEKLQMSSLMTEKDILFHVQNALVMIEYDFQAPQMVSFLCQGTVMWYDR